jgi:four helix bundle protein
MSKIAEELKARTKQFAVMVITFCRTLPKDEEFTIIKKQLIRSATSTAANYRAVCRSRSDAEFFSKLSIVVEEADETLFWLELINELGSGKHSSLEPCLNEATEIVKIFSKSRKTVKTNSVNAKLNKDNNYVNQN